MNQMINRALLVVATAIALPFIAEREAKAAIYSRTDNFDTNPSDWSPWATGTGLALFVVNDPNARSPNSDWLMQINNGGSTDFCKKGGARLPPPT